MPRNALTVECPAYPSSMACPIRVRYSAIPGTFTEVDIAASHCDCHLVHVQPTIDGADMEVHFTGCRNLADLTGALGLRDVVPENHLLCPFAGEHRQAGLLVGTAHRFMDKATLATRLECIGRPVQMLGAAT